jgi:hypothetical protein
VLKKLQAPLCFFNKEEINQNDYFRAIAILEQWL